jgi:hypothetical protein
MLLTEQLLSRIRTAMHICLCFIIIYIYMYIAMQHYISYIIIVLY